MPNLSAEMQERVNALDYDHCLHPNNRLDLPNGSVMMFSPDGSGFVHVYENPLLDWIVTIPDDTDISKTIQLKISRVACGISIALLNNAGEAIAEVGADYFNNQFSVIAHDPTTFDGQDPAVKECLIADVRTAVSRKKEDS